MTSNQLPYLALFGRIRHSILVSISAHEDWFPSQCFLPVESCHLDVTCDVVWEHTDDHVTHLQLSSKTAADATCVLGTNACLGENTWLQLAPMLLKQAHYHCHHHHHYHSLPTATTITTTTTQCTWIMRIWKGTCGCDHLQCKSHLSQETSE